MARKKLSDEEKEAKAIKDYKIRKEQKLASDLSWKINHDHIPEATVFFEVGERVIYGAHPYAEILEVYENGRIYKIKTSGDYNVSHTVVYCENLHIVSWLDIEKYRTSDENTKIQRFSKIDDLRLHFNQMAVSSLFSMKYGAGIDIEPDYQRGLVWTEEDKISLLDSIFDNIDIGKFVIIKTENCKTYYYEMLDGKQRLNALTDFYENKYPYKGKYFRELNWIDQNHFENYPVAIAELSKHITQKQKYAYFLKVNTTGKVVDKEHLDYVKELYDSIK